MNSSMVRNRAFLSTPEDKAHHRPRFSEVFSVKTRGFLPNNGPGSSEVAEKTIGEGMVDNETLGYFLARI